MTDIFIYLDTTWSYKDIVQYIDYIVQHLNINPTGSSIMLLTASDATPIVNRTYYISEFYLGWNWTTHKMATPGFKFPYILSSIRDQAELIMKHDRNASSIGARSIVALIVPNPVASYTDYDYAYTRRFLDGLNYTLPDIHFIYYGGGAMIRFKDFVPNPSEDIFELHFETTVEETSKPVFERIRRVPRRLSNPRCDNQWCVMSWGSNTLTQNVQLGGILFYRLLPHYFTGWGTMRYLKVEAISRVSFAVCTSRQIRLPFRNTTSPYRSEQDCKQIVGEAFSYDLTDICMLNSTVTECPPLYLSVQAQAFADMTQQACTTTGCSRPDDTQFKIFVNNLGCNDGSANRLSILLLVAYACLYLVLR